MKVGDKIKVLRYGINCGWEGEITKLVTNEIIGSFIPNDFTPVIRYYKCAIHNPEYPKSMPIIKDFTLEEIELI